MKPYKIIECPFCTAQSYDYYAKARPTPGSAVFECPKCGKKSYRDNKLEPALLSYRHYYDITFATGYRLIKLLIVLIYLALAVFVLIKRDTTLSMVCVAGALVIFIAYDVARRIHGKSYRKTEMYKRSVAESLARLENENYAELILAYQAVDEDCPYLERRDAPQQG